MADYDDVEPSKTLGGLTYQLRELGDGPHLQVAVRGHGEQGQRPLLGVLTMLREEWVQFAETGDADQVSAAVRAIHYPAYNEQNRDRGTLVPICPDCGGKAGVHPCGCWAGRDAEIVCAVCKRLAGSTWIPLPYPCPTVEALP